jgi:transcription initiation factor IIE alpha subunit
MDKNLLVGLWRLTLPVPPAIWKKRDEGSGNPLEFMTEAHHRVRDFAVLELTRSGVPLTSERIAQELQLPQTRVTDILVELERHKTFLFRNAQGAVTWAYPVTVDPTPHRVRFSTGEQVYAA